MLNQIAAHHIHSFNIKVLPTIENQLANEFVLKESLVKRIGGA
jgi:hypothetical protein